MKQRYYAYYEKNSPVVRIDLTLNFNSYDEMSDDVRALLDDGTPFDEVAFQTHTQTYFVDFTYLLGNLLASKKPFECLKKLFVGASENSSRIFEYHLKEAEKLYKQYISYNNFSLDFLAVFANEKRITINSKLYEVLGGRFYPLKIDSKTTKIIYGYESTNIKDVIFSTIHFALTNGYKLVKCRHCGKYFFVSKEKEIYCNRNSLFPEYEKYTCKKAVKAINDKLERKRISEYERLRIKALEYGVNSKHYQIWLNFCNTCQEYKSKLKYNNNIELLQQYQEFLFDSENVRKKYERIKEK